MKYAKIVYLGSYCNKDCTYCDRGYIKNEIGNQYLRPEDLPALIDFLSKETDNDPDPVIGFHGGEPFLFTQTMIRIIDALPKHYRFSILTNATTIDGKGGTELSKMVNQQFLEDYGDRLNISISYDFYEMKKYRGYEVDIVEVLSILTKNKVKVTQLQWVVPMDDPKVFNLDLIKSVVSVYKAFNIGMLTLIPMRHIRGQTKFKSLLEEVDVAGFMRGFLQFVQLLYVFNIKVSIDGHSHQISKDYFNDHKQIILSPDGAIYSEFDFLDYRIQEAQIGNWKGPNPNLNRSQEGKDQTLTYTSCHTCSQFSNCGIKYLYKMFEQQPGTKCKEFYALQEAIVQHYGRLSKYKNLVQAVK